MGCVEVPALPLQILLKAHPGWPGKPVVVVEKDAPQGTVLFANRAAEQAGVRPGMRYAAGLSLAGDLRAGTVEQAEIAAAVKALTQVLQRFTPHVEPSLAQAGSPAQAGFPAQAGTQTGSLANAGVFWLDLGGLDSLWPDWGRFTRAVRSATAGIGFRSSVAVGFTRFGTWAAAKGSAGATATATVFADPEQERAAALRVPMSALSPAAGLGNMLSRLDIRTVADFVRLPAAGVLQRFGPDAHRLHQWAAGACSVPLQPRAVEAPFREGIGLEDPVTDVTAALFLIKGLLHRLLSALAAQGRCLSEIELGLIPDGLPAAWHRLLPAAPTLDGELVLTLLRLRLETLDLAAGIVGIELAARGVSAAPEQLRLFNEGTRRDLAAGNRALAQIRAEYGEAAVVRAVLRDGHLPEARFSWQPVERMAVPVPRAGNRPPPGSRPASGSAPAPLVRRLYRKPVPIANPLRRDRDGTFVEGQLSSPIVRLAGPDQVSGGWWQGEVTRDYYYAELNSGDILWLYHDRKRRRWFLHGRVE